MFTAVLNQNMRYAGAGPKLLALSNKGSDKGRGERRRDGEDRTKKRAKRRESVEVERVSKE